MKIKIKYFASLREQRGLSQEIVEGEFSTVLDLWNDLSQKHQFDIDFSSLKVAVDKKYVAWDTPLNPMQEVVFIPPVAGG